MYDLGRLYEAGLGVDKDVKEAVRWYRRAASLGYRTAVEQLRALGRDP
jgi:TPR repeat protein